MRVKFILVYLVDGYTCREEYNSKHARQDRIMQLRKRGIKTTYTREQVM